MNGKYLLDTNIIIGLFNRELSISDGVAQANEVFIPSIVFGELHYGARKSGRSQKNIERLEAFAAKNTMLDCNADTARQYGEVKNRLRARGRPLPENDIWIAALALQYDLTLVTRDAHFQQVDGLRTALW